MWKTKKEHKRMKRAGEYGARERDVSMSGNV